MQPGAPCFYMYIFWINISRQTSLSQSVKIGFLDAFGVFIDSSEFLFFQLWIFSYSRRGLAPVAQHWLYISTDKIFIMSKYRCCIEFTDNILLFHLWSVGGLKASKLNVWHWTNHRCGTKWQITYLDMQHTFLTFLSSIFQLFIL